jgi:hypothetical protein
MHTGQLLKGKFTFFFVPLCMLRQRYSLTWNPCGTKTTVAANFISQHAQAGPSLQYAACSRGSANNGFILPFMWHALECGKFILFEMRQ